jgi:hypothetical protein
MLRGFDLIRQMEESKAVIGLNMLALWDDRGTLEPWIAPLRELLDDPGVPTAGPAADLRHPASSAERRAPVGSPIQPVVAAEIPFDRAPEAHRMLTERRNVGKVVLVP